MTVSKIQGDPSIPNIGKPDQALESLEKSIQLFEGDFEPGTDHWGSVRSLANALATKGVIQVAVRRQRASGIETLREAVKVADRLEARGNSTLGELRVIRLANTRLADFLGPSSPKAAIPLFEKSLAAGDRVYEMTKLDEDRVSNASALIGLARVHRDLGNSPEVVRRMESAAAILEPIHRANPASQNSSRQLGVVWAELARAFGNARMFHIGQPRRALEVLQRIESLREAQTEKVASAESAAQNFDALASDALRRADKGAVLLLLNPIESESVLRPGFASVATMLARDPKNGFAVRIRDDLNFVLAAAQLRQGKPAAALPIMEALRANALARLRVDTEDLGAHDSLGLAFGQMGIALIALRRWDEADKLLTDAEQNTGQVAAKYPEDLYFVRNQARVLEVFGDYHRARGNKPKSEEYYRRAIESWTRWRGVAGTVPYPEFYISMLRRKLAEPENTSLLLRSIER